MPVSVQTLNKKFSSLARNRCRLWLAGAVEWSRLNPFLGQVVKRLLHGALVLLDVVLFVYV